MAAEGRKEGSKWSEGEYALDSRASNAVPVLNIFKVLRLENIILYFPGERKCSGLSEIEVNSQLRRETFQSPFPFSV